MTIGVTAGLDPESFVHSRYIVLWACNVRSTNLHMWPFIKEAQDRGAKVVVIDPMRHRTAAERRLAHPDPAGHRRRAGLGDDERDHRRGPRRRRLRRALHGRLRRARRAGAAVPAGVGVEDHRRPGRGHRHPGHASTPPPQPAAIRIGVAVERHAGGGQTVRSIACLPALVGAWRHVGGGMLQLPLWAFPINWDRLHGADLIRPGTRVVNQFQLGPALTGGLDLDPPIKALFVYNSNPVTQASHQDMTLAGTGPRRPVHGGQRAVPHRHRRLRRHRPAGDDAARAVRPDVLVGPPLPVARTSRRSSRSVRPCRTSSCSAGCRRRMGLDIDWYRLSDEEMASASLDWSHPQPRRDHPRPAQGEGMGPAQPARPRRVLPRTPRATSRRRRARCELRSSLAEQVGSIVLPVFREGYNEFQVGGEVDPLPHYVAPARGRTRRPVPAVLPVAEGARLLELAVRQRQPSSAGCKATSSGC